MVASFPVMLDGYSTQEQIQQQQQQCQRCSRTGPTLRKMPMDDVWGNATGMNYGKKVLCADCWQPVMGELHDFGRGQAISTQPAAGATAPELLIGGLIARPADIRPHCQWGPACERASTCCVGCTHLWEHCVNAGHGQWGCSSPAMKKVVRERWNELRVAHFPPPPPPLPAAPAAAPLPLPEQRVVSEADLFVQKLVRFPPSMATSCALTAARLHESTCREACQALWHHCLEAGRGRWGCSRQALKAAVRESWEEYALLTSFNCSSKPRREQLPLFLRRRVA